MLCLVLYIYIYIYGRQEISQNMKENEGKVGRQEVSQNMRENEGKTLSYGPNISIS